MRDENWLIREGTFQMDGVYVGCDTHSSYHSHESSKHYFYQDADHIEQEFLSESQKKYFTVKIDLKDREEVIFGDEETKKEHKRILRGAS